MQNNLKKLITSRSIISSLTVIIAVMVLMTCATVMFEPYYTLAREENNQKSGTIEVTTPDETLFVLENMSPGDSVTGLLHVTITGTEPAYLWLKLERIGGLPPPGEPGDLYLQKLVEIRWDNLTIYSGPMEGLAEPISISDHSGPLLPGQPMEFNITISLPGPKTDNKYEGSTLQTRFVFYSKCGQVVEVPPEEPGLDPDPGPLLTCGSISLLLLAIIIVIYLLIRAISRRREGRSRHLP